jgi:hypothetical protein
MSTTITPASPATIRQRIDDLVTYFQQGRLAEAIEEFYADDVTMQENLDPPTVGKRANVEREAGFEAYVAQWHHARATAVLVDGNRAAIHWDYAFTGKDGKRFHYDQIALQEWDGDRIVHERFVYDPATTVAA